MKIYEVLFKFYKQSFFTILFVILQLFCCFTLLTVLLSNSILFSRTATDYAEIFLGKEYYLLTDLGDETGEFQEYLDSDDSFDKLNQFVRELRENSSFSFISTVQQSIYFENPIVPDTRFSYYDENSGDFNDGGHQTLKCVQLSPSAFTVFRLSMQQGEIFSEPDYTISERASVAVLLGSAYQEYFQIGDTFSGNFAGLETQFCVKGFLSKNVMLIANGTPITLDYYIVVPAFENFGNANDSFKKMNLAQQANGAIVTERKELNLTEYITQLSSKTGTMQFIVSPIVSDNSEELKVLSGDMAEEWIFLSIAVCIFLIIAMFMTLYDCVRTNYKTLAVHYICGASTSQLNRMVNSFLFSVFLIAMLLSYTMISYIKNTEEYVFPIFIPILGLLVFIIIKLCILRNFNENSFVNLLKE